MPIPIRGPEELWQRARSGDAAAAVETFDLYADHFANLARRHIDRKVRRLVDVSDVLQEIRLRLARGKNDKVFASAQSFLGYVGQMTVHVIGQLHRRYMFAQKRDLRREVSHLDEGEEPTIAGPEAEQTAWDLIEKVAARFPPLECVIHALSRDGYSAAAIAHMLDLSPATVYRRLRKIETTLTQRVLSP